MASINIGGENAGDAFYRYKMPKLQARIEGRGNGIKTNVVNCVDIAKALERPPDYVLKFFGIELGAQTKFDKKSGTSIVNGAHDAGKLSELLESFIKKYVQCYSCGNPETVVKLKKENILLKCKACGFVSEVDARLRLNGYIVKNPPENKLSKAEKKVKKAEKERLKGLEGPEEPAEEKKEKKEKKDKKKKKKGEVENGSAAEEEPQQSGGGEEEDEEEEEEDDVVWMTDTSAEAMAKRAAEQLSAATAAMVTQGNIEAEREEARRKEEARKKREEEEAAQRKAEEEEAARKKAEEEARLAAEAAAKLALEESKDPELASIRKLIQAGKKPADVAAALAEVKGGPAARMRVLYCALLGGSAVREGEKLAGAMVAAKAMLKPHAQDAAGQLAQLVAVEYLLGVELPGRVKEAPLLLKALYDADLAEEELIVAWFHKADAAKALAVPADAAKAVRAAAQPFVEWLEEAEDDSDDEEESDDE